MAEEKQEGKALGQEVGKVTHYYTKLGVGVVRLTSALKVGDKIRIKGATTDFEQIVESMQVEKDKIKEGKAGQSVGLEVKEQVRAKDVVYKI